MPNFKDYNQNQLCMFPLRITDVIDSNHICFVIDSIVDRLDLSTLSNSYSNDNGGATAYAPAMMVKLLFYAYSRGKRSSRDIEKEAIENIVFRYLSASQTPDHGTINLFRKKHLKRLGDIFTQIVLLCGDIKMIDLREASIDGSIFRADASRDNTFTKEQIKNLKKRIKKMLREAEKVDKKENKKFGAKHNKKGKQVEAEKSKLPVLSKKLRDPKTRSEEIERLKKKYEELIKAEDEIDDKQDGIENDNSLSRAEKKNQKKLSRNSSHNITDTDANLMKLKTGRSFKPGYNVQIATNDQVIMSYEISDNGGDTSQLIPLIKKTEKITKKKIETLKADAGYFSKGNIDYIKDNDIDAYIPDKNKSKEEQQEREDSIPKFDKRNFKYNKKNDEYICPNNKKLKVYSNHRAGINQGVKIYKCRDCPNCKHKSKCVKGEYRTIRVDKKLERQKRAMRKKLNTRIGKDKYIERMYDVEPVFGNITHNQKARRFLCRGKPMIKVEFGLSAIAHNLIKLSNWLKTQNKSVEDIQLGGLIRLKVQES